METTKKICPKCGRELPLTDYYMNNKGKYYGRCKECIRQKNREWYHRTFKKKEGVFYDTNQKRLISYEGRVRRIYWTGDMLSILNRYFANTKNEELADMIGVSLRTLRRKARELNMNKSKNHISKVAKENSLLAKIIIKNKQHKIIQ